MKQKQPQRNTHTHTYIYIYICVCVYVCVCVHKEITEILTKIELHYEVTEIPHNKTSVARTWDHENLFETWVVHLFMAPCQEATGDHLGKSL